MSEPKGKIAAGAGISCMGRGPASVALHNAMVSAALASHGAGEDEKKVKEAIDKARAEARSVRPA